MCCAEKKNTALELEQQATTRNVVPETIIRLIRCGVFCIVVVVRKMLLQDVVFVRMHTVRILQILPQYSVHSGEACYGLLDAYVTIN